PWLTPNKTLAASTHAQFGAAMTMKGTGRPSSQPITRTRLRPQLSASCPETRLATAFTTPKLMMNDAISVVDAMWNSSEPIRGTTVRSMPTMPPTNALIRTSNENCCQFSFRPSLTAVASPVELTIGTKPPLSYDRSWSRAAEQPRAEPEEYR